MKTTFHEKHLVLSDEQKDYVFAKIEQLKRFKVMGEESVLVRVDVEYRDHVTDSNKKILMAVTVDVPKQVLRAESDCISVEEGIDLIEPKLASQLEKYKTVHQ